MDKDIKVVKDAIESVKKSNWADKQAVIKQLEGQLDGYYEEVSKGYFSTEYDDAIKLVNSSSWSTEDKTRINKSLSEIYKAETESAIEADKVKRAAIRKAIAQDPFFIATSNVLRATGKALKSGDISEREAMAFLNEIFDSERSA